MLAWRNLKLYKTRGIAREVTERRGRFNKRWRRNAKYPWQSAGERYNGVLSPAGVLLAMAYVIILPSFLPSSPLHYYYYFARKFIDTSAITLFPTGSN